MTELLDRNASTTVNLPTYVDLWSLGLRSS